MTDERSRRFRRTLEGLLGVPATEGNAVDVLRNGDEIFPAMLDAIGSAQRTVDFLTYVYWDGSIGAEFASALAARAAAGVRVRVLLDAWGAARMRREWIEDMERAGVTVEWFRPLSNLRLGDVHHRTHRKVLVCDEDVGFTGGVGIADVWRGDARGPDEWRDTQVRVRGPAVDGLRAAFVDNWAETGRVAYDAVDRFPEQPQPGAAVVQVVRGAAEAGWSDITTLVRALLTCAEQRVRVCTAYFAPDEATRTLLCDTASRGVEVSVLLPGPHMDKQFCRVAAESDFDELLDAGVHIWQYQPTMLHAKVMTVDEGVAVVGSANLNSRSLNLDEEVDLVVFDPAVVRVLDAHFDEDLSRSERVVAGDWAERGAVRRAAEAATRLIGGQL